MDESQPRPQPAPPPAAGPPSTPRPAPSAEPRGTSRRWFLAGGVAVLAGAGAGAGAQFVHTSSPAPPPPPPGALVAAAAAERALIADLDATTGGTPDVRRAIVQIRADHAAHLTALTALLGRYQAPATAPSAPPGTPRTRARLRAAERSASSAAAARAGMLDRSPAAILASIAACEASHVELLR